MRRSQPSVPPQRRPSGPIARPPVGGGALRRPALYWALLHAPVILLLYRSSLLHALEPLAGSYRVAMCFLWVVEAAFIASLAWLIALPFSIRPRVYRYAAPAALALWTAVLSADSQLFDAMGFHLNGLFIRVLFQPRALAEVGIPMSHVAVFLAGAAVWIAADTWLGSRFIARFAGPRRVWPWIAALILLQALERVAVGTLTYFGGSAVFAAGAVLPLEPPLRMNHVLTPLTGRRDDPSGEPISSSLLPTTPAPEALRPDAVHFTRKPDVVLVLVESLRSDFLTAQTMPRLWARSSRGARFARHYASASSTHYALFSLFFGRNGHKLESVLGAGSKPLLLGAFRANGYQMRLITASSVDWMGMTRTVFADVKDDLDTDLPGIGATRDSAMIARARAWVAQADARPLLLVLFFDGTHFNYTYPARAAHFAPVWDGGGSLRAADAAMIRRRAQNAAYEVDWKLDELLTAFRSARRHDPLLFVTGDHGEAFREQGLVGHGERVTEQEIHVPMVVLDSLMPIGVKETPTSHVDVMPTMFGLLGDTHPAASYSDGMRMTDADSSRYVLSTTGWSPWYAVVGMKEKVTFFGLDAGLGGVAVTDPMDHPLPAGSAKLAGHAAQILRAFSRR
jgi:membrane-anchored protein YejM (alkaline phosphatase superfamily)